MFLNSKILNELKDIAVNAALDAGEIIQSYSSRKIEVKNKEGGDSVASQVVTEVDMLSQECILERLNPSLDKYDLALLSEESTDNKSRLDKDYFWCIDPMDGTLSFIESDSGYSVSIALVSQNGEPVIGVIYDPSRENIYCAIKGYGAYCNKVIWKPQLLKMNTKSALAFYYDRSFRDNILFNDVLEELNLLSKDMGLTGVEHCHYGGATLNAIHVLETAPACYFKFPKKAKGGGSLWDYAASACICKEAGGWVSDIYGDKLDLNNKNSTFLNEKAVLYASDAIIAAKIKAIYTRFI